MHKMLTKAFKKNQVISISMSIGFESYMNHYYDIQHFTSCFCIVWSFVYITPSKQYFAVRTGEIPSSFLLFLITRCKNRLSYFRLSTTRSNDTASYRSTKNSRNSLLSSISCVSFIIIFCPAEEALHLQHRITDRLKLSTFCVSRFDFTYDFVPEISFILLCYTILLAM